MEEFMKKFILFLLFMIFFGLVCNSNATSIVYDNELDYDNAVDGQLFLIDFNSSPNTYVNGSTISTYASFSSPEASNPSMVNWSSDALSDAGSTSTWNNVGPLAIDFTSALNAFSLDFSSSGAQETLELYDASNNLIDSLLAPNASGFFGVVSDSSISSVIIRNGYYSQNSRDRFFIDNLQGNTAAPVPEPATMLLLGSGIVGLAGFRRKFKKS